MVSLQLLMQHSLGPVGFGQAQGGYQSHMDADQPRVSQYSFAVRG